MSKWQRAELLQVLVVLASLLSAAGFRHTIVLNDTDWRSSRVSTDPVLPSTPSLAACVALCRQRNDCVAVSWTVPASDPPSENNNLCSLKCAARPEQRIHAPGQQAVVLRGNNATSCPLPTWFPDSWKDDIARGSLLLAGPRQEVRG